MYNLAPTLCICSSSNLTNHGPCRPEVFTVEKYPLVNVPAQFKPALFKGQPLCEKVFRLVLSGPTGWSSSLLQALPSPCLYVPPSQILSSIQVSAQVQAPLQVFPECFWTPGTSFSQRHTSAVGAVSRKDALNCPLLLMPFCLVS